MKVYKRTRDEAIDLLNLVLTNHKKTLKLVYANGNDWYTDGYINAISFAISILEEKRNV